MMSEDLVAEGAADMCCANCGKAEIDDIKLEDCDKCDLAKYCGDECKQNHGEIHAVVCKERAAELRDEILFRQPELKYRCPFCRKPVTDSKKAIKKEYENRAEMNDPVALRELGTMNYEEGDYDNAFEYYTRAAELGDAMAHNNLSIMYNRGEGVEKDAKMKIYHLEEAAIGGHPIARYNLGCYEYHENERYDRAVKHFIIAANLGDDESLQALKEWYKEGFVNKDDLASALRGYQAAVDHREIHEVICKERALEMRDEILFRQPESSHLGDCPICCLPIPEDKNKFGIQSCCGKRICKGCDFANQLRERKERLKSRCPFCRKPLPKTQEEGNKINEKRAAANDPIALQHVGLIHCKEGDYDSAFEYWTRAAELGDAAAHINLSFMYQNGEGVEKDENMEMYHLEEAAIAGHPYARYLLGFLETMNNEFDRAVKHFIIAANLGDDESLQRLKECYKDGHVSKDDYLAALRGYQAAVDAMKSSQREEAAAFQNFVTMT